MSLLIGESVEPAVVDNIEATIACHPMVADVVELLTRYLGAHEVLVAARVLLVDGLRSDQIAGNDKRRSTPVYGSVMPKSLRYS